MKLFMLASLMMVLALFSGCVPVAEITSFEECVSAGNPVMESYPRQCASDGKTFVEEIDRPIGETPDEEQKIDDSNDKPVLEMHTCTEEEKNSKICTREYAPVCAFIDNGMRCVTAPCASTDAKTQSNGCVACSNQAFGHYPGACEDLKFVVCKETKTGFDAGEFAKNSGGICVDICPGNYDPYVTQIGVEVCIQHYGLEEIESWETCEKSSSSCDCVNAYETTKNEPIEDAEYRCVPKDYSERLIFRGGLDKLDENGVRSVAIA